QVLEGLKKKYTITSSEIGRFPKNTMKLEKEDAMKLLKLMDELENHDDVQNVASNADIEDSVLEEFANS
ncbi:MAG: YebC/PmpR family DNA-binding transcriptional regulator, partial [Brevinematales bacterium]